jgi:hypothetical protein
MEPTSAARATALVDIERVMSAMWERLIPIGLQVLKLVALSKITSDLPSALALIVIITICLLPLAGVAVPDVLNNIALVVVGFYFGKREASAAVTSTTHS